MTAAAECLALADELEAADAGSRELDAAVAVAIKHELPAPMGECGAYLRAPSREDRKADGCAAGTYWLVQRPGMSLRTAPNFTTDLADWKRWCVPEGWVWHVSIDYELPGRATLYNAIPGGKDDPPVRVKSNAATPELAACAASLRAKAAMMEDEDAT